MARVYDFLLGGTNNFPVDREHAEHVCAALPKGIDGARANVQANRAFLDKAVRYLAGDVGIRQFLDVGTGIPSDDNVHAVAREIAADARVVYVDYDRIVLAHAHQMLQSAPHGATDFVLEDIRNPERILRKAARTLDFGQPVAIMLLGILNYIVDKEDPYGIVARLVKAVPSGSYLVVSHLASDIQAPEMAELARRHNQPEPAETVELRTLTEVTRFFQGLDLIEPGVVPVDHWRPHQPPPAGKGKPIHAGMARKP